MPIQKIEEVATEELLVAMERVAKAAREMKGLLDICNEKGLDSLWMYRLVSLRQAVAKLSAFTAEIDEAKSAIARGKPLGPEATKKRQSAREKADSALEKLSKARRGASARPD